MVKAGSSETRTNNTAYTLRPHKQNYSSALRIDMVKAGSSETRTNNTAYTLRPHKQNVAYADSSDSENGSNSRGRSYSGLMPRKPTKRRNILSSTARATATETEMVDLGVNSNAKRRRGRRSFSSKKTVEGGQNKETRRVGQSSSVEGSFLPECPSPSLENGSPSHIGQGSPSPSKKTAEKGSPSPIGQGSPSSSKKTEEKGQTKEISGAAQRSSSEIVSVLPKGSSPRTENISPSPVGQGSPSPYMKIVEEGQNKETSGVGEILRTGTGVILPEGPSLSTEYGSPSPVGQGSHSPVGQGSHSPVGQGSRSPVGQGLPSPYKKTVEEGQNKEICGVGQILSTETGVLLPEGPSLTVENHSTSPRGHGSSIKIVPSLPKGINSSKKTILSWLIDCNLIEEDEQIYYRDDRKGGTVIMGTITRGAILCCCCQNEVSVWTFEKHADSNLKQPYEHIYLPEKAACLQDYLIAAWYDVTEQKNREAFDFKPKETSMNQKDGACSICGNGGDLLCCKKCCFPNHAYCMNMKSFPRGTWLCSYCLCKYCGLKGESQLITCLQCGKIFHWECFHKFSKQSKEISPSRLYCSQSCKKIYEKLETYLAIRTDIFESYSWRVIRPMDMTSKLYSAKALRLENNLKVAVAFRLMNESFKTIIDRYTGLEVVHSVLYSRQSEDLERINFSRFHTFILEKDDAIICAASIRIHGETVAEMPFIATDEPYRGRGICRKLMTVIELFLHNLRVQNLIIPSILDTCEMWKNKYGFKELTLKLQKETASYNLLMLPNAVKLYKDLTTIAAGRGESLSLSLYTDTGTGNKDKQTKNHSAQQTQTENHSVQQTQTENHRAQQTQNDNTEGLVLDLNMDPI